jgi:hypothetical protein
LKEEIAEWELPEAGPEIRHLLEACAGLVQNNNHPEQPGEEEPGLDVLEHKHADHVNAAGVKLLHALLKGRKSGGAGVRTPVHPAQEKKVGSGVGFELVHVLI